MSEPKPMEGKYCPECLRVVDALDPTHAAGCPNGPPWDSEPLDQARARIEELEAALAYAAGAIRYFREPHHLDHAAECSACNAAAEQLDDALARADAALADRGEGS